MASVDLELAEMKHVRELRGLFEKDKWPEFLKLGNKLVQQVPHAEAFSHMAQAHYAMDMLVEAVSLPSSMQGLLCPMLC